MTEVTFDVTTRTTVTVPDYLIRYGTSALLDWIDENVPGAKDAEKVHVVEVVGPRYITEFVYEEDGHPTPFGEGSAGVWDTERGRHILYGHMSDIKSVAIRLNNAEEG